ncbi:MAG: FkbM family methyltransferase, partial [Alphaproteobacteria bacterium]|nr:FkbM family methyltransferase [Alphaproteobacteria bacterium]
DIEDNPTIEQILKNGVDNTIDFKVQRKAIHKWGKQLTEDDLNPSAWKKQPQYMFDHYIHVLSDIFKELNAKVNFILVGACDGTHDITISQGYLPNQHWRGVFVEPFEINYNDLTNFMKTAGVLDRTHLIHAAATNVCNSTTIKMKRPTFEEKNKSLPHWMRREIGAVVPFDKLDRPAMGGWIFEYVRCVNGPEILKDWALALSKNLPKRKKQKFPIRMRPHILKVDVEGHDYQVLSGFIADDTPTAELPLLISFEAKSIVKQFDLLKAQMTKR